MFQILYQCECRNEYLYCGVEFLEKQRRIYIETYILLILLPKLSIVRSIVI